MLEAVACGLLVSTNLAAYGIDAVNGEDMFVTDDYGEFPDHVIRLLTDDQLRNTVRVRARALGERFDHKSVAKKRWEVIRQCHHSTRDCISVVRM